MGWDNEGMWAGLADAPAAFSGGLNVAKQALALPEQLDLIRSQALQTRIQTEQLRRQSEIMGKTQPLDYLRTSIPTTGQEGQKLLDQTLEMFAETGPGGQKVVSGWGMDAFGKYIESPGMKMQRKRANVADFKTALDARKQELDDFDEKNAGVDWSSKENRKLAEKRQKMVEAYKQAQNTYDAGYADLTGTGEAYKTEREMQKQAEITERSEKIQFMKAHEAELNRRHQILIQDMKDSAALARTQVMAGAKESAEDKEKMKANVNALRDKAKELRKNYDETARMYEFLYPQSNPEAYQMAQMRLKNMKSEIDAVEREINTAVNKPWGGKKPSSSPTTPLDPQTGQPFAPIKRGQFTKSQARKELMRRGWEPGSELEMYLYRYEQMGGFKPE